MAGKDGIMGDRKLRRWEERKNGMMEGWKGGIERQEAAAVQVRRSKAESDRLREGRMEDGKSIRRQVPLPSFPVFRWIF